MTSVLARLVLPFYLRYEHRLDTRSSLIRDWAIHGPLGKWAAELLRAPSVRLCARLQHLPSHPHLIPISSPSHPHLIIISSPSHPHLIIIISPSHPHLIPIHISIPKEYARCHITHIPYAPFTIRASPPADLTARPDCYVVSPHATPPQTMPSSSSIKATSRRHAARRGTGTPSLRPSRRPFGQSRSTVRTPLCSLLHATRARFSAFPRIPSHLPPSPPRAA